MTQKSKKPIRTPGVPKKKKKGTKKKGAGVTVIKRKRRTVLAVHGTGSPTIQGIYDELDIGIQVKFVRSVSELYTPASAILLLGGPDIGEVWYDWDSPSAYYPDTPERDYIEYRLVQRAKEQGLPLFGICRGHQMITAQYGGTLWKDLAKDKGLKFHPSQHLVDYNMEELSYNVHTDHVNSYHHQATKTVPPGFDVAATSKDGVIEAIYKPGVLGVQWHPELLFPMDHEWAGLFEWHVSGLKRNFKLWDKPLAGTSPSAVMSREPLDKRQVAARRPVNVVKPKGKPQPTTAEAGFLSAESGLNSPWYFGDRINQRWEDAQAEVVELETVTPDELKAMSYDELMERIYELQIQGDEGNDKDIDKALDALEETHRAISTAASIVEDDEEPARWHSMREDDYWKRMIQEGGLDE